MDNRPPTDKPPTMSDKDYLIKRVSREYQIPEATVRTVVENSFRTAKAALSNHNSIELAGFGRFYFNLKKANHKLASNKGMVPILEKKRDAAVSQNRKDAIQRDLNGLIANTESLTKKINNDNGLSQSPY